MGANPLMQTIAIFHDAYRELNAKRLFWFVLAISGFVVAAFSTVGLYDQGLAINLLVKEWRIPFSLNSQVMEPTTFYKFLFVHLGIGVWLAWAATGLALISTAGVIPSFLASGSIELTLSKPIGRVRLFLTKYLSGLMFVGLQVLVFAGGAFLTLGLRGQTWEPRILLAVPIVLAFFSYLFCMCALFAVLTRSTIASLLLTMLMWLGFWGVSFAEHRLLETTTRTDAQIAALEQEILGREETIRAIEAGRVEDDLATSLSDRMTIELRKERLADRRSALDGYHAARGSVDQWQQGLFYAKTILPKTGETIGLLDRYLLPEEEMAHYRRLGSVEVEQPPVEKPAIKVRGGDSATAEQLHAQDERAERDIANRLRKKIQDRPLWWVLGTSLGFEAIVLAFACFIFARRDF